MVLDTSGDVDGHQRLSEVMLSTVRAGWSITSVTEEFIERPVPADCRAFVAIPRADTYPVDSIVSTIERILRDDPHRRIMLESSDHSWTQNFATSCPELLYVVVTRRPLRMVAPA